ncbi:MAG: hypothetical protein JXA06_04625 [Bacteroidetes bacterium]|nr:hypothetical protein [Bacteroidota bacterium]
MNIPVLVYITLFTECIVAMWVVYRWRYSTKPQRLISFLIIFTAISAIADIIMAFYNINNLWLGNISNLVEYAIILYVCYLWKSKKISKIILISGITGYSILWIISKFTFEPIFMPDSYTSVIAKIIEIIVSALILFDVLQDTDIKLKNDVRLWFSSGVIIYSSGTLFLFGLFNMMLDTSPELIRTLWPINWILSIVYILLLARGVWCRTAR